MRIKLYIFKSAVLSLATFLFVSGYGQSKDTLQEVFIIREKEKPYTTDLKDGFTAGQQQQKMDTALRSFYQMQSLARLIAEQSTVFVKSYGVNGMSTLSFRGASSAQSAVYWNGIPLSGSSLSMVDISLLNAGLFDDVSLQYGSSSALFGSGNVGGALILKDNLPDFSPKKQINLAMTAGSFKRKNLSLNTLFENKRIRVKGNVFYQHAENNFRYIDHNKVSRKMENAENSGLGGILAFDYNLGKNTPANNAHLLSARLWYQRYDRDIPPALFESSSEKEQLDRSFKSLIHWQKTQKRSGFYVKLSYIKDFLAYEDSMISFYSENSFNQLYAEAGWSWRINSPDRTRFFNQDVLVFTPVHYGASTTKDAENKMEQWRYAIAAAYKLQTHNQRFILNVSLRQERIEDKNITLPGGSLLYKAFRLQWTNHVAEIHLRGNIQKTYRTPSLNELYFSPGGNENLKPERGWSEDAGFVFKYLFRESSGSMANRSSFVLENETSFFNRNIQDWIYWLGGAIWTPHNLAEVHSRGVETDNRLIYQFGKAKLQLAFKTAYILSTTQRSYMPDDGSVGKQIPYAPRYSGQVNIGLQYGTLFLNYNHLYSGYRFITVDESQFLKPYNIGNVQAWYQFNLKTVDMKATLQVLNAGNKNYEIVGGRPMPGRHFLVGLGITI